jgi:hypothetical protein
VSQWQGAEHPVGTIDREGRHYKFEAFAARLLRNDRFGHFAGLTATLELHNSSGGTAEAIFWVSQ